MYDFSTAVETSSDYITKPGYYLGTISPEVQFVNIEGKTPYLTLTFETKYGNFTHNFFITQKALGRLKALFRGVWNRDLDKTFKDAEEVANYFKTALKKPKEIGIRVFMKEANNGKFYADLPFSDFISGDLETFKERVVEPTDKDYDTWVLKASPKEAPATTSTIITESSSKPSWETSNPKEIPTSSEVDDLPF